MINGTGATCGTDTTKWCPLDLLPFSLGKEVRNHCVPNEHWMMHIRHVFYGFLQGKPGYLFQHISTMFNHSWPSKSMRHSPRQWRNNRGHQGKSSGLADAAWHRQTWVFNPFLAEAMNIGFNPHGFFRPNLVTLVISIFGGQWKSHPNHPNLNNRSLKLQTLKQQIFIDPDPPGPPGLHTGHRWDLRRFPSRCWPCARGSWRTGKAGKASKNGALSRIVKVNIT